MHIADTKFFRFRSRTSHLAARRRSLLRPTLSWLTFCRTPLRRKRKASPASLDCSGPLKRICSSPRCSPPTAPPSPLKAPRGAQATSPHWRPLKIRDTPGFLPAGLLQVAGSVHAVRDAQHFPCISISFPCLYGLIRSYLHARGHCELSSTSAKCIFLPSGGRSERGPRVDIPLELFHSPTSVCLPSHLEGPAKSVALGPSYDAVRLHTPICSVNSSDRASVLQQEVSSLLLKGTIDEVPSSDLNRDFLVLKKDGICILY